MSEIGFTYNIVSVDEATRCMEVIYTSEGRDTMHIGARLPFEGENVEDVILAFAPLAYWREKATPVVTPLVGTQGFVRVVERQPLDSQPTTAADQPTNSGVQDL